MKASEKDRLYRILENKICERIFRGEYADGENLPPERTLAVVDHNVPTTDRSLPNPDPESAIQIAALAENTRDFGIEYYDPFDRRQGIVHDRAKDVVRHLIGPEVAHASTRPHELGPVARCHHGAMLLRRRSAHGQLSRCPASSSTALPA